MIPIQNYPMPGKSIGKPGISSPPISTLRRTPGKPGISFKTYLVQALIPLFLR